jgi:hypothetical protein
LVLRLIGGSALGVTVAKVATLAAGAMAAAM